MIFVSIGSIIYYILHRKNIINNFKKEKEEILKKQNEKVEPIINLKNKKVEFFKDKTIIPKTFSLRKVVKNNENVVKNEKKEEKKIEKNTNKNQETITIKNINKDKKEEIKNKAVRKASKKRKSTKKRKSSKKKKK